MNDVYSPVSDVHKDVDYPLAVLRERSLRDIPEHVLGKLVQPSVLHANQGSWLMYDGVSYIGVRFPDMKLARKSIRTKAGAIIGYNWPTNFGRVVSFSLIIPGLKRAACCRTLVPFADQAIDIIQKTGQAVFVMLCGAEALAAYDGDFRTRLSSSRGLAKVLDYDENPGSYDNFAAAYWSLHAYSREGWSDRLDISDNLPLDWVHEYALMGRFLQEMASRARVAQLRGEFEKDLLKRHTPLLQELVLAAIDCPDPRPAIREILSRNLSGASPVELANTIFWDCWEICSNCQLTSDEVNLVDAVKYFVILDPQVTNCGRRLFWTDTHTGTGTGRTLELNGTLLGQFRDTGFWAGASCLPAPVNIGHHLIGDECLAVLRKGLGVELASGVTKAEAEKHARSLLTEATSERQWTIPWSALVDFQVGVFRRVEIFEVLDDFCFHLWTEDDRCVLAFAGRNTGDWVFAGISDDGERIGEQVAALQLLLASIVRDFCVVEERERLFQQGTGSRRRRYQPDRKRIMYLPRVKYIETLSVDKLSEGLAHDRRTPHFVVGHLRKSESRSPESEKLARAFGFTLIPGYTFVRPHRRGLNISEKEEILFRSRSALELMLGEVRTGYSGVADWFKFELDVQKLMQRFGFNVQHRAANRSGDGGVDIYAEDVKSGEAWAIQCKCYRPDRKVGPAVVRELVGALRAYPSGTKGMLMATCAISIEARKLADEAQIFLLDGNDLAEMLDSGAY